MLLAVLRVLTVLLFVAGIVYLVSGCPKDGSGLIKVVRWTARLWSIPAILLAPMALFLPALDQIEWDWVAYSLVIASSLGLLISWRWEMAGSIITLIVMVGRIIYNAGDLYELDLAIWGVPAVLLALIHIAVVTCKRQDVTQ